LVVGDELAAGAEVVDDANDVVQIKFGCLASSTLKPAGRHIIISQSAIVTTN
jgi:hypothetical protein